AVAPFSTNWVCPRMPITHILHQSVADFTHLACKVWSRKLQFVIREFNGTLCAVFQVFQNWSQNGFPSRRLLLLVFLLALNPFLLCSHLLVLSPCSPGLPLRSFCQERGAMLVWQRRQGKTIVGPQLSCDIIDNPLSLRHPSSPVSSIKEFTLVFFLQLFNHIYDCL